MRLLYNNKEMSSEPANMPMFNLAMQLANGYTVYVCLEPGDATRYDFLITPVSAIVTDTRGTRGLSGWADNYKLVLTRLYNMRPAGGMVCCRGMWEGELAEFARGNNWTVTLFDWWLEQLWKELERVGGF